MTGPMLCRHGVAAHGRNATLSAPGVDAIGLVRLDMVDGCTMVARLRLGSVGGTQLLFHV
jgi:hypothetical protein